MSEQKHGECLGGAIRLMAEPGTFVEGLVVDDCDQVLEPAILVDGFLVRTPVILDQSNREHVLALKIAVDALLKRLDHGWGQVQATTGIENAIKKQIITMDGVELLRLSSVGRLNMRFCKEADGYYLVGLPRGGAIYWVKVSTTDLVDLGIGREDIEGMVVDTVYTA